ncbi:MAG: FAD-binding protein, partial [Pseudomonadota bacterium]
PVTGEVLETGGLSGITLYEPGALTLVAQAGTPLSEVEATLDAENQMLPFEPPLWNQVFGTGTGSTIGGVVATNASGPRRLQAGACRDSLIGVRFVDGQGTVLKNGGRVMKNVTGYDLVKLMSGSHGTLGVLTEVAFKVLPKPERTATVLLEGLDESQAVAAMSAAMSSPYDVTGAGHNPQLGQTGLRLEGFEKAVAYRAGELAKLLSEFGTAEIVYDPEPFKALVEPGSIAAGDGDVWRISVKPSDGPDTVARLNPTAHLMDWAGGLIWARVPQGTDVRHALDGRGGHATLMTADAQTKARLGVFHPEPAPLARISAGLRAKFDPRGILNPGRMAPAQGVA